MYNGILVNIESTTYTIPGIVTDVSDTFVETTIYYYNKYILYDV